jgi:hypothetical protein
MNESQELPEKPLWESHTANGLYTFDRVAVKRRDGDGTAIDVFMVNRTSVRARNATHEVRYYATQSLAEAAARLHDQTGEWTGDGEITVPGPS